MMTKLARGNWLFWILAVALTTYLSACGGGGGGGGGGGAGGTSVSGKAVLGPIQGATVEIFSLNSDGTLGTQLGGATTTDGSGNFTISIGTVTGAIAVRITGNDSAFYVDEATGSNVSFTSSDVLLAFISDASAATITCNVTSLTHLAASRTQQLAPTSSSGLATLINDNNQDIADLLDVSNILTVTPVDLNDSTADDPASEATRYALVLAGLAQEAETISAGGNSVTAMDLTESIINDFKSDGLLNGITSDGSAVTLGTGRLSPTACSSDLGNAIETFVASPENRSGVDATEAADLVDSFDTVLEGQTVYTGSLPTTISTITFTAATGDSVTEEAAFPGWVSLVVSPSVTAATLQNLVAANGGTIIDSIPLAGLYEVSVTPGQEAAFIAAVLGNSNVKSAWPTSPIIIAGQVAIDSFPTTASSPLTCANALHGQHVSAIMNRDAVDTVAESKYDFTWSELMKGLFNAKYGIGDGIGLATDTQRRMIEHAEAAAAKGENVVINMSLQSSMSRWGDNANIRTTCMTSPNGPDCKKVQAAQKHFFESILNTIESLPAETRQHAVFVVAAGNAGVDLTTVLTDLQTRYPTGFKNLKIVGATFSNGNVDERMNHSTTGMVYALGNDVPSFGSCTVTGTSFASPEVTRVLAKMWKTYPTLTPDRLLASFNEALTSCGIGGNTVPSDSSTGRTTTAFETCALQKALARSAGSVTVTGTPSVMEGGATDTFQVVLTLQPEANVTVSMTSDSQVTLGVPTLTFTSSNWNTPQTVTVTAVDDSTVEGTHTGSVSFSVTSTDAAYSRATASALSVTISDNDQDCGNASNSGGSGVTSINYNMGSTAGTVNITYEMYSIPDQMDVYYNGALVASTGGFVSGGGTLSFSYTPTTSQTIRIVVTGNTDSGTAWFYNVDCPQ